MKKLIWLLSITVLVLSLQACVLVQPEPGERIVGTWQTRVGGFPVTVEYTQDTVRVADYQPVPYQLDGDRLTFQQGGSQVRIVSFPAGDEMVQTDPLTGTAHRFIRVEQASEA